jgi:hypothetical protein
VDPVGVGRPGPQDLAATLCVLSHGI